MTWNNRIIRHKNHPEGVVYGLHEVMYDVVKKGQHACTDEPVTGYFESIESLIQDLEQKLEDAKRSKTCLLDIEDFGGET